MFTGEISAQNARDTRPRGLGRRGQMGFPQNTSSGRGAARLVLAATLVAVLVAGCGGGSGGGPGMPTISGGGTSGGTVKVALLLPLTSSGNTPAVAKALKQAAELALFDFDNPSVVL